MIKNLRDPAFLIATWFGLGLLPFSPGTFGSLGALPFGHMILQAAGLPGLLIAIIAVSYVGWKVSDKVAQQTGTEDNQIIVIDEVAGMWIVMLGTGLDLKLIGIGLLLFRVFDITKIGPVGWAEKRFKGGQGVMADDLVAGLCALLCLLGLRYAGLG